MPRKKHKKTHTTELKEAIMIAMENMEPGEMAVIHRYSSNGEDDFNHINSPECLCNPMVITASEKKMTEDEIELVAMMMMAEMMYADQTKTYH